MALIEVKNLTLMQGSVDDDGDTNAAGQSFHVRLDAKPATLTEVLTTAGASIPARGNSDGQGRVCTKRTVSRLPSAALTEFIVTCDFEFPPFNVYEENPLIRKDEVSFGIDSQTESFFIDNSDSPMRVFNTNGERFDTLPERTTGGVKLIIEGNRASFDAAAAVTYCRPSSTNAAGFTVRGIGIAAGQAKLTSVTGKPTTEGSYNFWRINWELCLAPDWISRIENMGYIEVVDGKRWPILRGTPPEPITSPWPLNEDGTAKPKQTDAPFVIEFKPYPKKPFDVFNWTAAF